MSARFRSGSALVAALLLAGPALAAEPAAAAPAAPRARPAVDEARERFTRGVQLFHEGSLEASLAEFQKAYQIAPSYRLHYNIAQVQYELHNYVEALRSFWKYLAQGGNEVPAARRADVEGEIRKLEKRVGFLTIKSSVDGAQISVDGVPMGISPFSAPVLVNPGARRVTANKAGYQVAQSTVTVAGGDRMEVALQVVAGYPSAGIALAPRPSPFGSSVLPSRLWLGVGATALLASSAAVFAIVANNAETSFQREVSRVPNTRDNIESARSRMTRYAAVTDVLLGAAAVASAVTVYFAITDDGPTLERAATGRPSSGVAVRPSLGGLSVAGRF